MTLQTPDSSKLVVVLTDCNGSITAKHFGLNLNLSGLVLKLEANGNILRIVQPDRDHTAILEKPSLAA